METSDEMKFGNQQIPEQIRGTEINTNECVRFENLSEALSFYQVAKQRLLDVNQWYSYGELPLSVFKLFDHSGRTVQRSAQAQDYIRIDIPGPGTTIGQGYDWVIIEKLFESTDHNSQIMTMQVRPSSHPLGNDEQIAHFLKNSATNTLQVKQIDAVVYAEQHARNEETNNTTDSILDNFRNIMVGWSSKLGFSYPQWKSLIQGLLKMPD